MTRSILAAAACCLAALASSPALAHEGHVSDAELRLALNAIRGRYAEDPQAKSFLARMDGELARLKAAAKGE